MFTIETLWKIEVLRPLQKVYEANAQDRRLVVIPDNSQPGGVNLAETVALHGWLETQGYQHIPDSWETADLDTLDVVHVSKLTIAILRRDPFAAIPSPLTPNSWLNQLPQERFDALLLAQAQGNVARQPTRLEIKDSLKPQLEAVQLSAFWAETVADVKFAQSGDAPKNQRQKDVLIAWSVAVKRRHYDPTATAQPVHAESPLQPVIPARSYVWWEGLERRDWNHRMTALRKWICSQTRDAQELQNAAVQVLGNKLYVRFVGQINSDAHSLVEEAMQRNKLDELAAHYDYVQDSAPTSAFNQTGQKVGGSQINVTIDGVSSGLAIGQNIVQNINIGDKIARP